MPSINITINTDNAAFSDCTSEEVARILHELATDLEVDGFTYLVGEKANLRDYNGNTVGEFKVVED